MFCAQSVLLNRFRINVIIIYNKVYDIKKNVSAIIHYTLDHYLEKR